MVSKYKRFLERFACLLGAGLIMACLGQFVLIFVQKDQIKAFMRENAELKASLDTTEEKIENLIAIQTDIKIFQAEIDSWFSGINKGSFAKLARYMDNNLNLAGKNTKFASLSSASSPPIDFRLAKLELFAHEAHFESSSLLNKTNVIKDFMVRIPSLAPVSGYISSPWGARRHPLSHKIIHHDGVDLVAPLGTPVVAPANGVVITTKRSATYGNLIEIKHEDFVSRFGHLQEFTVKIGDRVAQGEIIGKLGNSGQSSGAHLHYEIHDKKNKSLDPTQFMVVSSHSGHFF